MEKQHVILEYHKYKETYSQNMETKPLSLCNWEVFMKCVRF